MFIKLGRFPVSLALESRASYSISRNPQLEFISRFDDSERKTLITARDFPSIFLVVLAKKANSFRAHSQYASFVGASIGSTNSSLSSAMGKFSYRAARRAIMLLIIEA